MRSRSSPGNLDIARAKGHDAELSLAVNDKDMAGVNHRLRGRMGKGHGYAPSDGQTVSVPRFKDDLATLIRLTDFALLPLQVVMPHQVVQVFHGFCNASGKQFGTTVSKNYNCKDQLAKGVKAANCIRYHIGLWTAEEEEESSNFKKLKNLVDMVGEEAMAGRLQNCKFFLFTDDSTAESCFYCENSKS